MLSSISYFSGYLLAYAIFVIIFAQYPANGKAVAQNTTDQLCGDHRLYFEQTNKCYIQNSRGPCGEEMELVPSDTNKNVGECQCISASANEPGCPLRPRVYWKEASRCYFIYDQGPCKSDEWLVPYRFGLPPKCERIPCLTQYKERIQRKDYYYTPGDTQFLFPHEGKCYFSNNQGADVGSICPIAGDWIYFRDDGFVPLCYKGGPCSASSLPDNSCPDGSPPDPSGGCTPNADI